MGQARFKPENNGFMPELPGIGGLLSVPSAAVENFLLQQAMELTDTIAGVDSEMQQIRERLEVASDKSAELDLIERQRKLELPIT